MAQAEGAARFTLDEWRRLRNLTQREMAQLIGVHENTYRRWEKYPERIKVREAERCAEVLNLKISDIIFDSNSTKCRVPEEETA